jgi:hypothetical protein
MTNHVSDELPRLLTGEASHDDVMAAAAHLRTCVDCQNELVSHVVAHASLTSAQRFAPEVVHRPASDNFTAEDSAGADPAGELPDLSAVFAQVRREADEGFRPVREHRRRPYLIGAAAAVVAVVGGGALIYAATSGNDHNGAGTRTVALGAFDQGHTSGTATIGDGTISLDATSLPKLSGKRYEVWLTNDRRTRMQPIGWIGNDGRAQFTVPPQMMTQYGDLEVSVQNADANDYTYSGTSVLRGSV